jgi:hypothetical protein
MNQQSSYRQRTNTIDYINNLIIEYNIDLYEDFQRKIASPIKIRLLKGIGYIGQNLVRQLIKIHNTDILQSIITKKYLDLLHDNFNIDFINYNNIKWLQNLFKVPEKCEYRFLKLSNTLWVPLHMSNEWL